MPVYTVVFVNQATSVDESTSRKYVRTSTTLLENVLRKSARLRLPCEAGNSGGDLANGIEKVVA